MAGLLSDRVKTTRVMNGVTAGTTVQKSTGVDMTAAPGFNSVRFTGLFGALTTNQVTSMKVQHSDTDVDGDYVDVTGAASAALADADGNKMIQVDVKDVSKRYYRAYVSRATANAVIDGVIAEQYDSGASPVTQPTSVKQLVSVTSAV